MFVLGISALYHDSAAALIENDNIIACAQEERFTRVKHDNRIPVNAIRYSLKEANIDMADVDAVVYYDNPMLTLDRYVRNIAALGKEAQYQIDKNLEAVLDGRMTVDRQIRHFFGTIGKHNQLNVCEHHISHAASAFYPSPFESAAILTIDGVGEWATTTIGKGKSSTIEVVEEIDYPHSLGLMYSAFTSFCGFKVNEGDYKFMGLAPYGTPKYYDLIREKLVDIKEDGSFRLNLDYFDYYRGGVMTNDKFSSLFGGPPRVQESRITKREMDIAASAQKVAEDIIIGLAKHAKEVTGETNLVMAGGVALNCVANGKLLKKKIFDSIWIQPAAGDAGGALGCALYYLYNCTDVVRKPNDSDSQNGSYLGPKYDDAYVESFLKANDYRYHIMKDDLYKNIAKQLSEDKVVGWFQGRMEYGPRALGNRSILGNPMSEQMQSVLNLKIKYRESFRPFAPAVIEDKVSEYFELNVKSPYMLLCADVKENRRLPFDKDKFLQEYDDNMLSVVNAKRSDIPAVTHIDYSARIQTVSKQTNERFYRLLEEFEKKTGCAVLINTSFNVRGEPIVCTPEDAYRCFMRTGMDILVLGDFVLYKNEQRPLENDDNWRDEYVLD